MFVTVKFCAVPPVVVMLASFLCHCNVVPVAGAILDDNIVETVDAPHNTEVSGVTTGAVATVPCATLKPVLIKLLQPEDGFVTTTVYVPDWLTVIVWLLAPMFTVGDNNEPFKNHCKVAVVEGATLDLIFNVPGVPQSIDDAPTVAVETDAVAGKAAQVTAVALLTALGHPPTCVATTV